MAVVLLSSGAVLDCRGANVPSERRVRRPLREIHCMWRVRSMGQKRISPRLIPSWQWSVLHRMVPPPPLQHYEDVLKVESRHLKQGEGVHKWSE